MSNHPVLNVNDLLRYWTRQYDEHGVYPTIQQATDHFDLSSTSIVFYWLNKLVDSGALVRFPNGHSPYRLPKGGS